MIQKLVLLSFLGLACSKPQSECPVDGQRLLSHESDCSKFYNCVNGVKVSQALSCPEGSLFSFKKQSCIFAFESDCVAAKPQSSESQECPSDGQRLLPHESDCSKYYNCVSGVKASQALSCAAGTLFSFEKQRCVFGSDSSCVMAN